MQLPLELLNPDKGIGIQASLKVPIGTVGAAGVGGTSTGTSSGIGIGDATSTTGTTDASSGVTTASSATTSTSSSSTTTTIASFTVNIDGNSDLVPFVYGATSLPNSGTNAIMLSSHATAFDLSQVGGIQGTLTLTNLTGYTGVSGLPDIQATAETLSADGTRHEVVLSVPVHSDGTFLLYPLPTSSSTPAYYDVVIHGPGIATIIIKNVELAFGSSSTTTATGTAALSAATITSTDSSVDTTTITPPSLATVSIGTLIPRYASTYTANITPASGATLPAGTQVNFYETVSGSGEVPYVIESSPIDPFNQDLFNVQMLSACTVDSGTYVASGETINVISAGPGAGTGGLYRGRHGGQLRRWRTLAQDHTARRQYLRNHGQHHHDHHAGARVGRDPDAESRLGRGDRLGRGGGDRGEQVHDGCLAGPAPGLARGHAHRPGAP